MEDIFIVSGVYAAGTISVLVNGRSCSRGVRAHKLCFETLFRLLWKAFLTWYAQREEEYILMGGTVKKKLKQHAERRLVPTLTQKPWEILKDFRKISRKPESN